MNTKPTTADVVIEALHSDGATWFVIRAGSDLPRFDEHLDEATARERGLAIARSRGVECWISRRAQQFEPAGANAPAASGHLVEGR